jgi:hypothetical protein
MNPELYKMPAKTHPRLRWGLKATVGLINKHMFPWMTATSIMQHVQTMRRTGDKNNPIRVSKTELPIFSGLMNIIR